MTSNKYDTTYVITSIASGPVLDNEDGVPTKVIPVDKITGKLIETYGNSSAIVDVEGKGPIKVDTGINNFFYKGDDVRKLTENAIEKGHDVTFEASGDDRFTSMRTRDGSFAYDAGEPKIPYNLLTWKEVGEMNQYIGQRGSISDEVSAKDNAAIRNFLKMPQNTRKTEDLIRGMSGEVAVKQTPKTHARQSQGKSKGNEL